MDPMFEAPPHILYMIELLEAIEAGSKRRVIINMPPRHGKTRLCSQLFPAWFLGRNPRKHVILASHSAALAEKNSRGARACLEHPDWPFECRLSTASYAADEWTVNIGRTAAGGLLARGVGGGVTGHGGDLIVEDDAEHDATSETERKTVGEWHSEVLTPRLEPYGAQAIIATRWHMDDLTGQCLEAEDGHLWEQTSFPAISEEDDVLGRHAGEALWPKRMPLEELNARRVAMGARAFSAQFQQNPVPAEGSVFRAEWFEHRYRTLPAMTFTAQFVDSAWKKATGNDRSAIATWGTDGINFYLIDCWAGKMEYPELKRHVVDKYAELLPNQLLVEDKASGTGIIQELSAETNLPIKGVQVDGDKIVRAQRVTPMFEAGKVYLPEDSAAPWVEDWIQEHLRFPNGRYDDQVDTTSGALAKLREYTTSKPFGFSMNFQRNQARW